MIEFIFSLISIFLFLMFFIMMYGLIFAVPYYIIKGIVQEWIREVIHGPKQ